MKTKVQAVVSGTGVVQNKGTNVGFGGGNGMCLFHN